jgi:hypothetical protein
MESTASIPTWLKIGAAKACEKLPFACTLQLPISVREDVMFNYRIAAGVVLPEKIEIEPVGGRKCVVLRIIQQNFGPVVQWFYVRVHQYVGP